MSILSYLKKGFIGFITVFALVLFGNVAPANAVENKADNAPLVPINLSFIEESNGYQVFGWEQPGDQNDISGYKVTYQNTDGGVVEQQILPKVLKVFLKLDEQGALYKISVKSLKGTKESTEEVVIWYPTDGKDKRGFYNQNPEVLSVEPYSKNKIDKNKFLVKWKQQNPETSRNSGTKEYLINLLNSGGTIIKGENAREGVISKNMKPNQAQGIVIYAQRPSGGGYTGASRIYVFTSPSEDYYYCPDVEIISARGSGEPFDDGKGTVIKGTKEQTLLTNEQISEELPGYNGAINGSVETVYAQTVQNSLETSINPETNEPYKVDSYAVPYPAVEPKNPEDVWGTWTVEDWWKFNPLFGQSINKGTEMVIQRVIDTYSICPNTKIVLSGYSQGALVMGDAIDALSKKDTHVDSVILFGDPFFNPLDISDRSNYNTLRAGMLAERDLWEEVTTSPVASYCHDLDVFCNITDNTGLLNPTVPAEAAAQNNGNVFTPHESYPRNWEPDNDLQATQEAAVETVKQLQLK